ncbi:type VII secretion-associated serine protease mycosin [Streptomyces anulatus]|uniref:type VII secretion-associated serine protease mycosin n=1 Tax=Streptomyces anulatus TaxID=1892 RepID=UPI0009966EE5|nr:type VII secretion-associated serine protease mycosin [Streptomyces anulatus]
MRTSSAAVARRGAVLSAVVAPLLVGAVPAHADSVRSEQWHLNVMQAEQMWKISTGENVTVAVIDSGVDASVPDLQGRVLKGKNLATDSPGDEHTDYANHGTGIAGLIAGTGNAGGRDGAFGLAPRSKILPIRVRDSAGKVNGATGDRYFNDDLSAAIRFAADQGAEVINVSLGNNVGSQRLTDSVSYALDKGSLVFAAAGNSGDEKNSIEYPAGTPGVVGVGSVGRDLRRAKSSQYGPQVDLAAPGVDTVHACSGGTQLCKSSGTSHATALASASAALIWSKHPDWTNNQVLRVMLNTAGGPISGKKRSDGIGYGIVRPRIALKTPGDPGPADVYPLPDLAAAASEAPSPQPSKAGGGSGQSEEPAVAAADEGSNTVLWLGVGIGAAVLVGGAATAAVLRSRRREVVAAPAPPTSQQQPYPHHQYLQPPHSPYGPPPNSSYPEVPYGAPPGRGPGSVG